MVVDMKTRNLVSTHPNAAEARKAADKRNQ